MIPKLARLFITAGALAALLITLAVPASASAATSPIQFSLSMYSGCVWGLAAPDATVSFAWRSSDGKLKAEGSVPSGQYGTWEYCDPAAVLMPADRINVKDGTNARTFVAPNLTASLDRVNDIVTGTGPAGRTIRLCSTFALFGDYEKCHGVRVGANGTWAFDPKRSIIGDIWVTIYWTSPNKDHLWLSVGAPQLRATIGRSAFSGYGTPFAKFTILVNGIPAAKTTIDSSGSFAGDLRRPDGHKLTIAAGDRVTAPSLSLDADWVIPDISGSVDRFTNEVTGVCGDSGTSAYAVRVSITRSNHIRRTGWQPTEPDGSFTMDFNDVPPFGGVTNIRAGDHATIACMQTEGDYIQLRLLAE